MQTIFAWLLVIVVLVAPYPWASWLLARSPRADSPILTVLVTLALGTGALSLLMFWQSLLGLPLTWVGITAPYLLLMLPGWRLAGWQVPRLRLSRAALLPACACALVGAAILFNAVYWPFSRDDAVAIYAFYGEQMAQTGAITPLPGAATLYEAYPIHISLTYTYAYLASGWINEYLARLFPALLSIGALGAAYVLGQATGGAGWPGAVLLALTPTFGRWASSGYVDLPMAFFYTLAAVFAWRLWQDDNRADALLAGLMMGLAAWTKNAALLGVLFLALWLGWGWMHSRISWRRVGLALLACAAVAAPWYIRSLLDAGMLIPSTAWTEQARQTADTLLILPALYGLPGWLMLAAVLLTLVDTLRRRFDAPANLLLLLWTVPFFGAWWLFASYDPRFLLLFLPVLCVMAGLWLARAYAALPPLARRYVLLPVGIIVLALALVTAWNSVEYKKALLRDPFMSHADKRALVLPDE